MSLDPEVPAGLEGPVTTTVTRRVKPGHEAAYEAFLAGINNAARAFPGYLGVEVFRPAPGRRRQVPLRGSFVTKGRTA
jgi:antibiotic biosynthesis monooxygenase (ABM) superfamily enzyme